MHQTARRLFFCEDTTHSRLSVMARAIDSFATGLILLLSSAPFRVARGSFVFDGHHQVNTTTQSIYQFSFGIVASRIVKSKLTLLRNGFHFFVQRLTPTPTLIWTHHRFFIISHWSLVQGSSKGSRWPNRSFWGRTPSKTRGFPSYKVVLRGVADLPALLKDPHPAKRAIGVSHTTYICRLN